MGPNRVRRPSCADCCRLHWRWCRADGHIRRQAVASLGIARAETSLEANYQVKLSDRDAFQPDVQYLIHPAGFADAPNSLGLGLRFVFTTGFPHKANTRAR